MPIARRTVLATAAASSAALLAACSSNSNPGADAPTSVPETLDAEGRTLTVWVMQDDYNQESLDALSDQFTERTGAKADVQIQQWDGIDTKLSTALSTDSTPDIVDIGNTQVAGYAENGALMDLTEYQEDLAQGQTWLGGLVDPATISGRLYACPGFAGARSVIYNRQMWEDAGITEAPTTSEELTTALDAIKANNSAADFSALYLPGQHWYVGFQFVWDEGGEIATEQDGTWSGGMSTPEGQAGLEAWKTFQNTYSSEASRTLTTDNPEQEQIFADGKAAAIIATNGAIGAIQAANPDLTDEKISTFALPGKDGTQPVMLGGSDWAIAAKSSNKDLALVWAQIAASPDFQSEFVFGSNGWIPNSEEGIQQAQPSLTDLQSGFFTAALKSKATPAAPGWTAVEGATYPQELFSSVASGKADPADAAATFDDSIESALNG